MIVGKRTRRKLGSAIAGPIEEFLDLKYLDRLIFVERDHAAALKTRAAVVMYIGRHNLDLTTRVKDDEIWVLKDKDILEETFTVDLRR